MTWKVNDALYFRFADTNYVRRVVELTEDGQPIIEHLGRHYIKDVLLRSDVHLWQKCGHFERGLFGKFRYVPLRPAERSPIVEWWCGLLRLI